MTKDIINTNSSDWNILIRLMCGSVFLSEGIQKFLFAEQLGVGRFAKIGIPNPGFFAPTVGTFEIVCGIMVLVGFYTRIAVIPLLSIIVVALITTKLKILEKEGIWAMLHESRTDWSMLLAGVYLLLSGSGRWSIDSLSGNKITNFD